MTSESDESASAGAAPTDAAWVEDFLDRLEANGRIADRVRELLVQSARLVVQEFSRLAKTDWPLVAGTAYATDHDTPLDERGRHPARSD